MDRIDLRGRGGSVVRIPYKGYDVAEFVLGASMHLWGIRASCSRIWARLRTYWPFGPIVLVFGLVSAPMGHSGASTYLWGIWAVVLAFERVYAPMGHSGQFSHLGASTYPRMYGEARPARHVTCQYSYSSMKKFVQLMKIS